MNRNRIGVSDSRTVDSNSAEKLNIPCKKLCESFRRKSMWITYFIIVVILIILGIGIPTGVIVMKKRNTSEIRRTTLKAATTPTAIAMISATAPTAPTAIATTAATTIIDSKTTIPIIHESSHWTLAESLNRVRYGHDIALLANGIVITSGGSTSSHTITSRTEFYSPSSGWFLGSTMRASRDYHTFTAFANNIKVLTVGGGYASTLKTAEVYDSTIDKWTYTSKNPSNARYLHTAVLLGNGQILIAGGYGASDTVISAVEIYVPSTNSFTNAKNMKVARAYFTSTLLADKSTVLVTGGFNGNKSMKTAELYIEDSWIFTSDMTQERDDHAAVLLNDGTVLIAGGGDDTPQSYSTAEIYNAATRTFTAVGSMKYRRHGLTLTLLPSGKVLATGGYDRNEISYVTVSELYDPLTRSWSNTRILHYQRIGHRSILLNDSVLTIGGWNFENEGLTSCEKYYL